MQHPQNRFLVLTKYECLSIKQTLSAAVIGYLVSKILCLPLLISCFYLSFCFCLCTHCFKIFHFLNMLSNFKYNVLVIFKTCRFVFLYVKLELFRKKLICCKRRCRYAWQELWAGHIFARTVPVTSRAQKCVYKIKCAPYKICL